MTGGTISTTLTSEVTLGTGVILSPLTITATGRIAGPAATNSFQTAAAIYVGTGLTGASIFNHGQISGVLPQFDSFSIPAILAESPLYLGNTGTIVGQSGIYLNDGGTLRNSGLIAGSDARSQHDYGIRLFNASLINSGTVYGAKYGATSWNRGEIANTGTISGNDAGVDLISTTMAYGGTLINNGSIYSLHSGVTASQALITNTGSIDGQVYGIRIAWGSTISNSGDITGSFEGVMLLNQQYQTSEDSTLLNSGSIGGNYFGVAINFSRVTNAASGTIHGLNFGAGAGENSYLDNAGNIYGVNAGVLLETGGLAINSATVKGGGIGAWLLDGGVLTNATTGYVAGGSSGVRSQGGYVLNAGTLTGATYGLELASGGIAVTSGQIISQGEGVYLSNTAASTTSSDFLKNSGTVYGATEGVILKNGTVYNLGKISGGAIGVSLVTGTSLSTAGSIYGQKYGVQLAGGTVVNSGTITGKLTGVEINHGYLFNSGTISGATYAVSGQSFTLALIAQERISGKVVDKTDTSTLALGGTSFGTLAGLGTTFSGFPDIDFVPGAHWMLVGDTAALIGETINGFSYGDTILITGFTATGDLYYTSQNDLALFYNHQNVDINLDITGPIPAAFVVTESSIGTTITLACFVAGTRILTPDGEVPVQELEVGDTVITSGDGDQPIIWIGKRTINLRQHPAPATAQPICITANALAENVPSRDLWVSPDHGIYIDGYLVPAKALLNDTTIHSGRRRSVTYYHIELERHAIVFAENTGTETYLESGNRAAFENGGATFILHPDFANQIRRQRSCAVLIETGNALAKIRAKIIRRSKHGPGRVLANISA